MNHLTDFQLNEYLDHTLDQSTQSMIRSHIESCTDCHARWEELSLLHSTLKELKDIPVPHDLTSSVLTQLSESKSRHWNPFFAAQLGVALGAMIFIAMEISQSIRIPSLFVFQFTIPALRFNFSILESFVLIPTINIPQFPVVQIPQFNLQTFIMAIFIVVLGLIINILLLSERREASS